jgi:hypothetical protein
MVFGVNIYTIPLFLAAFICLGLLLLTVVQQSRKGAWPMIGLLLAIVIWTISYSLMLESSSPQARLQWQNVRFIGPTLATLSVFVFALEYTGRGRYVTRRNVYLLAVVPVLTNLFVWTNFMGLVRETVTVVRPPGSLVRFRIEWGPWFYVHAIYSYLLGFGAIALFAEKGLRFGASPAETKRTRMMLLAVLLPLVGSLVHVAGFTEFDFAPFGFAVSAVMLLAAIALY